MTDLSISALLEQAKLAGYSPERLVAAIIEFTPDSFDYELLGNSEEGAIVQITTTITPEAEEDD